jgi:hypothetical protein
MAGFAKEELYFIARMSLDMPNDINELSEALLPELKKWREQAKKRGGDHSDCADNFLNEVIPYLVEVLIQDGIYFIVDFPQHPVSQILKSLPGYDTWAVQARARCDQIALMRDVELVEYLNTAARAAFERQNRRIDSVESKLDSVLNKIGPCENARTGGTIEGKLDQIIHLMQRLLQQPQAATTTTRATAPTPTPTTTTTTTTRATTQEQQDDEGNVDDDDDDDDAQILVPDNDDDDDDELQPPPPQPAVRTERRTVNDLHNSPEIPAIQSAMPKSFRDCEREWRTKNLDGFRKYKNAKQIWKGIYDGYKKREFCIDYIRARTTEEKDDADIAEELDEDYELITDEEAGGTSKRRKGKPTLAKVHTEIFKAANNIVRRAPKRINTREVEERRASKRRRKTREKARRIEARGITTPAQPRGGDLGTHQYAERSRRISDEGRRNLETLRERFMGERFMGQGQGTRTPTPVSQQQNTRQPALSYGLRVLNEPGRLIRLAEQRRAEQQVAERLGIAERASRALEDDAIEELQRHRDGNNPTAEV